MLPHSRSFNPIPISQANKKPLIFNAAWPNSSPPRALSSLTVSLSRPRPLAMSDQHEDKDANDDNRWEASAYMAKVWQNSICIVSCASCFNTLKKVRISWKNDLLQKDAHFGWFLKWFTSNFIHVFWWFLDTPKLPENLPTKQHLRHERQAHTGAWQLVKKDALVVHLEGGWGNSHPNLPKMPCESTLTFHDFGSWVKMIYTDDGWWSPEDLILLLRLYLQALLHLN